jgi:hypothetical protein
MPGAEIVKTIDKCGLTVREAHPRTAIAAADFSRIRQADLARFLVDRFMTIVIRLGTRVDLAFKSKRPAAKREKSPHPVGRSPAHA